MLRNVQIKIVLIFLIIGIIAIVAMGYINYAILGKALEVVASSTQELGEMIQKYGTQVKIVTLLTILIFTAICIPVRNIFNTKNNITNSKVNK